MGILKHPVVKLLKEPDLQSETVTEGKMGEAIEILEVHGKWLKIKTLWDNYPGFVPKESVLELDWEVKEPLITASLSSIVYQENKIQSPFLQILPIGIKLRLLEDGEKWLKVELPDRTSGYIQKGDIVNYKVFSFESEPQLRNSLVKWAEKFENSVPYVWGGTSSFGADCSGFVQHLFRLHNLPLERDASQQGQGKYIQNIKREEILPGDLLFFTNYGHVGLAISHFEFIHATTNKKPVVQVSQIDDPHWLNQTIQYSRYQF